MSDPINRSRAWAAPLLAAALALAVRAQEPTFMEAATHPGSGQLYARLLFSAAEYRESSRDIDEQDARVKLAYGLLPELALLADSVWVRRQTSRASDSAGLSEVTLRLKYRFFKHDSGPLDTWRASLLGGLALPGSDEPVAPDEPYPRLGAVTTLIRGRHGLNAQAEWLGRRDEPDTFAWNASHLYRLAPAAYGADTTGAWYTMLETLNETTAGGDARADLAFGILYEAWSWAWEVSLRLPLAQDSRRETEFQLATGLRLLF